MTPDVIAARQELDLRPQLERLDRLIFGSEGIDEGALGFAFRPLWQLDEPAKAALALTKAQATQIYAGLGLWPAEVTAKLVEAQLVQDRTYPNATAVFAEAEATEDASGTQTVLDVDPAEPRDLRGRWVRAGGGAGMATGVGRAPDRRQAEASHPPVSLSALLSLLNPIGTAEAAEEPLEDVDRRSEELAEPADLRSDEVMRSQRFTAAWEAIKEIDPDNDAFRILRVPGASTSEAEVERLERAVYKAKIAPWRATEGRSENSSPLAPRPQPSQSALNRYYGNPQSPGPFAAALYPEIEAGPKGVTLEPDGGNATKRGSSYEEFLVEHFDLDKPDETWEIRGLKPDATASDVAIEVKYTDDFSRSIYNPERGLSFVDREVNATIEQAMKYANGNPPKNLVYYTNDWSLAEYHTRAFRGVGLSNFRFIIVSATRRPK